MQLEGWNLPLVICGAAAREIVQLSRVSTLGQNELFRSCTDNLAKGSPESIDTFV